MKTTSAPSIRARVLALSMHAGLLSCIGAIVPVMPSVISTVMVPAEAFAASVAPSGGRAALAELRADRPWVRVFEHDGVVQQLSGALTQGTSPAMAATDFVHRYAGLFGPDMPDMPAGAEGLPASDLRQHDSFDIAFGKNTVFAYQQFLEGLPVEFGTVRVTVLNRAGPAETGFAMLHEVVHASGRLAAVPEGGFSPDIVTAAQALETVWARAPGEALETFEIVGEPSLVVWAGFNDIVGLANAPRASRAWKIVAQANTQDSERAHAATYFVDASTGAILFERNEVHSVDITGRVEGLRTEGVFPDTATNPPVINPARQVRVDVVGSLPLVSGFADINGNFTIPWTGTDPVMLAAAVGNARWTRVVNASAGGSIAVTQSATPGTPAVINMLSTPAATTTAQMNALYWVQYTHDFFREFAPGFTALDTPATPNANVNQAQTCNAVFMGSDLSTNYYLAGGGCPNSAYSSVINHEYGHFIVNRRGLPQGAFGEGFADCISVIINNDPIIARDFFAIGNHIRNLATATTSFPCNDFDTHVCGQVLAKAVWDMTSSFTARDGTEPGLMTVRQLFADWAMITAGPDVNNQAAHVLTATEFLTADDDDNDPTNGTPNYNIIAAAFSARNIPVPCREFRATVRFDAAIPEIIMSNTALTVPVTIMSGTGTVLPGTARFAYRASTTAPYTFVAMTPVSGNSYTMQIPAIPCGTSIEYYAAVDVTIEGSTQTVQAPLDAQCNGTTRVLSAADAFTDSLIDFDSVPGGYPEWVVASAPSADYPLHAQPAGRWVRAAPLPTTTFTSEPREDTTPAPGINCFLTGRSTGATQLNVDGGATVLASPVFDLSAASDAQVSYKRWWSSNGVQSPARDFWKVEVSVNNGATWTTAETLTEGIMGTAWATGGFTLSALGVTTSAQVRFRFVAGDFGSGNIVEAGLDDFRVQTRTCNAGPTCDTVDFNRDGVFPDTQDLEDFLTVFGGGNCPSAMCGDLDFNNDGVQPDSGDIDTLLRVFGGGGC